MRGALSVILLPFFLLFLNTNTYAKGTALDLKSQGAIKADTVQLKEYFEKAYRFLQKDLDSCWHYSENLLELSNNTDNSWGRAYAYSVQAAYFLQKRKLELAFEKSKLAENEAIKANDFTQLSFIYNLKGMYSHALNDSESAIENFIHALNNAELAKDYLRVSLIAGNIGFAHLENNNIHEAGEYYDIMNGIVDTMDNLKIKAYSSGITGLLHMKKNEPDKALKKYMYSIQTANEIGDVYNGAYTKIFLGELLLQEKDFQKAEVYFKEALLDFKNLGNIEHRLDAYISIIKFYNEIDNYEKSVSYGDEAFSLVEQNQSSDIKMQFFKELATAHANRGDYNRAYNYYKEYKTWADSIFTLQKAMKMLELDSNHKLETRDLNIQLLNRIQEENRVELKQKNLTNIISFLCLLLISIISINLWNNNRRKENYNSILEQEVNERTNDLRQINLRLVNSNEELERFAYITSHDLKEPIRNINSFAELANRSVKLKDEKGIVKNLSYVKSNAKQMYGLIEDVLNYSKLETNLEFKEVDLNQTLLDAKRSISTLIDEKKAVIVANELPIILGSEFQLFQLFKNLIENGIKYNDDASARIDIIHIENPTINILKFVDNGIGIDTKYHDEIFTMFKRLHTKSEYMGSGLGLATVKKIVNNLNGTIQLDSQVGKGSVFIVTLPKLKS